MLKIIASYFFIVFGLAALWVSTSRSVIKCLLEKRDNNEWWGVNQLIHGDLASISHLDYLNKFSLPTHSTLKRANYTGPKNTTLFIHGDSYLYKVQDSIFAGISSFHFTGWNNQYHYHLDSSKRNVLIIEVAERLVRNYYGTTEILDELCDTTITKKNISSLSKPIISEIKYSSLFFCTDPMSIFNKNINQNLEYNLFNYNFMMPLFGCKAAINYYLFSRASGDVVISKDKHFLFYKETVSFTLPGSSFSPLSDDEITHLVSNFNIIHDYYKATGFKEIYLSIIPSTVTIMQPEGYNNLIPRIQNDKRLKMKIIDAWSVFKKSKELLFFPGDTHWNNTGKQIWVDMVNEQLTKE